MQTLDNTTPDNTVLWLIGLVSLFTTGLITAQLTASKVLQFQTFDFLPLLPNGIIVPGAVFAYAITYFASDCLSENYGKRTAQIVVNIGLAMNFLLLALVWLVIAAPASPTSIDPTAVENVLGSSTNIVIASVLAYVVSQNADVLLFHRIKTETGDDGLWIRNIGSTLISQGIDTLIFITLAFLVLPSLITVGPVLELNVLLALIIGQYLVKLTIALLDTPFVYLVTAQLNN